MKKYLLILVLFTNCATQKKAEKYYSKNKPELALKCMQEFPVDTVYKQGEIIVKSDTTIIKGDSVACPPAVNEKGETTFVKVKCPDRLIIHDSIKIVDTITKLDNAAIAYITNERNAFSKQVIQTTTERNDARKTANNRLWWIIALAIALTGSLYFNLKNKFYGRTSKHSTA